MFANPLWSLLLLIIPVLVYRFIISPRLRKRYSEIYVHIESFWARQWARVYAFRTFVISAMGTVLAAAPDLLVAITPLDFSTILPQPWGLYVGTGVAIAVALMKAFETKPGEVKA